MQTTEATPAAEALATAAPLPAVSNPAAVFLARLSAGSRRTMGQALRTVAAIVAGEGADPLAVPWHALGYGHAQAIRAAVVARYSSPASANKHLAALRGVLREAWRLGLMSEEARKRASDFALVRGSRTLRGRALSAGEVRAIFAACDSASPLGARDAALLAVLYGCGLRRAEVAALQLAAFDAEAGTLRVLGKGNKERISPVPAGARAHLARWLEVRGAEAGPLFVALHKSGAMLAEARAMTPQAVLVALRRIAAAAGVARFSPHDLRRSFVSDLLDAGADLSTVQGLAGHASPATTALYDRRGEHARRRASDLLHVPA